MKKIVLFGTGAQAREVHHLISHDSPYEVAAFAVDSDQIQEETLLGLPVVPFDDVDKVYPPTEFDMHIAVGYVMLNRLRAERFYQAKEKGYRLISIVSSNATIWTGLPIGENCLIGPNSTIYPSCKIGDNVIIGTGCIIPHDSIIEDHCFVGAGVVLSGWVTVKQYCFIGTGAVIRNNVTIGQENVIGAGALILENTADRAVYMGKSPDLLPISSDKLRLE